MSAVCSQMVRRNTHTHTHTRQGWEALTKVKSRGRIYGCSLCSCNFSESSQVLAIQIVNKKEYPSPHFTKRYRLVGKLWVCGFSSSSKHSVLTDSRSSTTEDPQTDTATGASGLASVQGLVVVIGPAASQGCRKNK